tara:strand:- start:4603 stop:4854 length:252 start_codon:yes stop_codon:yes gene_type:complete
MYAEFTELITGGIQQGSERKLVINLDKVIAFRAETRSDGAVLETRRGDVHVKETYDQVKNLFNSRNGVPPVLLPAVPPQDSVT